MQQSGQEDVVIVFVSVLAVWTYLVVWTFLRSRKRIAQRLVPFERRRPVPWGGIEVILLMGTFLVAPVVVAYAGMYLLDIEMPRAEAAGEAGEAVEQGFKDDDPDTAHAVEQLLRENRSLPFILVAGVMAVLVAPVVEEMLFRVVLQGWLEKLENRLRRRLPRAVRAMPGAGPVLFASLLFAGMHAHTAEPKIDAECLVFLLSAQSVASLMTLLCGAVLLCAGCGATLSDVGIVPRRLRGDAALGLLVCMAVTGPVYLAFYVVQRVLPGSVAADPIPLVLLAIILGSLYYRTHRVVPSIVLHAAFNATGLTMVLLAPAAH